MESTAPGRVLGEGESSPGLRLRERYQGSETPYKEAEDGKFRRDNDVPPTAAPTGLKMTARWRRRPWREEAGSGSRLTQSTKTELQQGSTENAGNVKPSAVPLRSPESLPARQHVSAAVCLRWPNTGSGMAPGKGHPCNPATQDLASACRRKLTQKEKAHPRPCALLHLSPHCARTCAQAENVG